MFFLRHFPETWKHAKVINDSKSGKDKTKLEILQAYKFVKFTYPRSYEN